MVRKKPYQPYRLTALFLKEKKPYLKPYQDLTLPNNKQNHIHFGNKNLENDH